MKRLQISFQARLKDAIGEKSTHYETIDVPIHTTIETLKDQEGFKKLYDKYEHISNVTMLMATNANEW